MPYKDKQQTKLHLKEWTINNRGKRLASSVRYQEKDFERKLLISSKSNSKRKGREHTICKEDIIIPEYCPYLGIKLTKEVSSTRPDSTASLDRIDSTVGYTKNNIQVISRLANIMKSYATEEQLITFAKNVLKIHDKDSNL